MKNVLTVKITLNKDEAYAYIDEDTIPIDDEELVKKIVEDLEQELCYPVGSPGNRNKDAVNISCMLYALGVEDPWSWLDNADHAARNHDELSYIIRFIDHDELKKCFKRVKPYLESWNRNPKKGSILGYTID